MAPRLRCDGGKTAVQSRKSRMATLLRSRGGSRGGSTAVDGCDGYGKTRKTTGGVTTVMAVLTKNRSGTAPPLSEGYYVCTKLNQTNGN